MTQRISALAASLCHPAPALIEGLLALHLTGNPLPILTLIFQKDR